ncbi:uncharacterized protein LOC103369203 isoform X2 [Stegastes partitus]|uniref:Uncharacterized LOC103369203 n=1 Tax=Stegastes partitus TaxID=144197 RepID=A0A3B5AP96_9TELE|nr:PREDICTED: uncharacterized protein LOC103369203 isoform X2 [Stegastes partitus]
MKLWLEACFLFALLFVSSSALTPECEKLVKPLSLDDHSKVYGRKNLLLGYTDNAGFKGIQKAFGSYWMDIMASPSGPGHLVMDQQNRINGVCTSSTVNMTVEGNTARIRHPGVSGDYQILPSCEGCLSLSVNYTIADMQNFLERLNVNITVGPGAISSHSLFLMANRTSVTDSDMEHFNKQVECFGFSGEPDFRYDEKTSFCPDGENIEA